MGVTIAAKGHRKGLHVFGAFVCLIRPADNSCYGDHAGKKDAQYHDCNEQSTQTEARVCGQARRRLTLFGISRVVGIAQCAGQLSPPRVPFRDDNRSQVDTNASAPSTRFTPPHIDQWLSAVETNA